MVTAVLVNDTQNVPHLGCQAVSDAHARMLRARRVEVTARYFNREIASLAKIRDPEELTRSVLDSPLGHDLERADAVIVNGEGTIHHGRGRELLAVLAAAQRLGRRSLLVNCVFQEVTEFEQTLSRVDDLTVRDARSSRELDKLGIAHRLVLDSVLEAGFADAPERDFAGACLVTDWHGEVADTVGAAIEEFARTTDREVIRWPLLGTEPAARWRLALAEVATARSVVAARHHGAYLGAMAGVPFVLLGSNSHKIEGFIEWTGLPIPLCRTARDVEQGLRRAEDNVEMYRELQARILAERPLTTFDGLKTTSSLEEPGSLESERNHAPQTLAIPELRISAAVERGDTEAAALICRDWWTSAGGDARRLELMRLARRSSDQTGLASAIARTAEMLDQEPVLQLASGVAWRYTSDNRRAIEAYKRVLSLDPVSHPSYVALGIAHAALAQFEDGERALRTAVALRPGDPRSHFHLAKMYEGCGRFFEAIGCLRTALALDSSNSEYFYRLGRCLYLEGWREQAVRAFDRCLEIDPGHSRARFECGMARVHLGDFGVGWDMMESRWQLPRFRRARPDLPGPEWNGSTDLGGALWVWSESTPGIGLEILYCSLIPELVESGVEVALEVDGRLSTLLQRSLPDVEIVNTSGDRNKPSPETRFAAWIPSGSLPRVLRRSPEDFRRQVPFLAPDSALRDTLRSGYPGDRLIVGISWRTASDRTSGERSVPLQRWNPILQTSGCSFVSLQYGETGEDLEDAREASGIDVIRDQEIDPLGDLDPYVAQIAAMDLVITIDNSTAHLAGALGVPCWCLVPRPCYWQWPPAGSASRWYPSVRLVRQGIPGRWDGVVTRMADELAEYSRSCLSTLGGAHRPATE